MNGKSRRSWFVRIMLSLLILVIATAGVTLVYWNTHKKEIVRNKIEKAIEGKSNGLYKVKYADMQMNEIGGNASFTDMDVRYDSATYLSLKDKPALLLNIHIPSIHISGIKTPKAILGKEIVGRLLEIVNPSIEIIYTGKTQTSKHLPSKEIYEALLGNLKLIKVDTVALRNATIVTRHLNKNDKIVFSNATIVLANVAIDSVSNADSTRLLFARTLDLQCKKISWTSSSKQYAYDISDISFNSDQANMSIRQIDVMPQLPEDAFVRSFPFQADRFDMHYKDIRLTHVNKQELMAEVLVAEGLYVGNSSMKIYCDLAIPPKTNNPANNYPHQQILALPVSFEIRKAIFANTYIEYRERNDVTRMITDAKFYDGEIRIDNLANTRSALKENNTCRLEATTSFLHLATVKLNVVLPVGDPQGKFTFTGSVGGGDATKLNPLLEPTALVSIRKGTITSLDVNLKGDNTRSDGTVILLYDGLKVDVLELDKDSTLDKKSITSFVGNILVKDANPKKGDSIRVADVHHIRGMHRSLLNFIWKSIAVGINISVNNPKKMKRQ